MESNREHGYAAPAAAVLVVGVGLSQAWQDFRSDDWTYLRWAAEHTHDLSFLLHPPPFPYFRPLNALAWQAQEHSFGTSPWPIELLLLGLWGAALLCLYWIAARRAGPAAGLVAVALALVTPEIRGLPNWRSWLTTAGALAGVLGAIAAARSPRVVLPFALLAFGAGFKEGAWWHGALALGALGRTELAAASLAAYVVQAGVAAGLHTPGELGLQHVPGNLLSLGRTLFAWGWPLVLGAVALAAPREAWRGGSAWLIAAGLAGTLPALGFYLYNPYYVIEPLLVLLIGLIGPAAAAVRRYPIVGWFAGLAMATWLSQPSMWADYGENVPYHAKRAAEGRALAVEAGRVSAVWAPADDPGPCGLAAGLLEHEQGARRLEERPIEGRAVRDCLVVLDR